MNIEVAKHSGFCFGVRNTIKKIEDTLAANHGPVYSVGLPVHNSQLSERLEEKGLRIVDSVDQIEKGVLIVRAHGLPPQDMQKLIDRHITIVDATCPFVKKAQQIAQDLSSHGYTVIVCGEKEHPEVKAIAGCITGNYAICSSPADPIAFERHEKIAILSQTTQSPTIFHDIIHEIVGRGFNELRIFNTICRSVEERKKYTRETAKRVDVVLVVGGKMSSNTKRLYEIALETNPHTYHIETAKDIDRAWFHHASTIGISAGASTPDWIIDDVVRLCQGF